MSIEFQPWPKTSRLFREVVVTEKIDGTNACVVFEKRAIGDPIGPEADLDYIFAAQSRNRIITPDADNAGFATWVHKNHEDLFSILGYGRHYGEWWGQGIQRRYNMPHKVFSVFNVDKWDDLVSEYAIGDAYMTSVPVLGRFDFDTQSIINCATNLIRSGSTASRQFGEKFDNPEGICVFHSQSRIVQKFTFDNNDRGKWEGLK